ncbi:hypothetical protein NL676_025385 [Syzygium grande]|nr:hypothetical protein NL676_025385 [Syzygium grande]
MAGGYGWEKNWSAMRTSFAKDLVVKAKSLEVKKLVYLYLPHYAEKCPNEALLSINCFQRDLGGTNPLVRVWALRTMAGIHLHIVTPLVIVAVNKCARHPSVYVRKCAANAVPKLFDLRIEENTFAIEEVVVSLFSFMQLLFSIAFCLSKMLVVVAAATVHWIMAPMEDVKRIVKPLLFVLRSPNASRYVG